MAVYPVRRRAHAQQQIERHVDHLAHTSPQAAARFVDAFEQSIRLLSEWPESGSRYESEHEGLSQLRKWVVPGFRRFLVFYRFENNVVELIDVVDGRSDFQINP